MLYHQKSIFNKCPDAGPYLERLMQYTILKIGTSDKSMNVILSDFQVQIGEMSLDQLLSITHIDDVKNSKILVKRI